MQTPKPRPRCAFTLKELLVVIAIVAVLLALLLPMVQKTHEAAGREQSLDNLRRIGQATHCAHDAHDALPPLSATNIWAPITTPEYGTAVGFTFFDWLLPYLDEQALFDASNRDVKTLVNGVPVYGHPVKAFLCRMDPSSAGGMGRTQNISTWAVGNYAANYQVLGNPNLSLDTPTPNPPLPPDARMALTWRNPHNFSPGRSQTIYFAERYGTCGTDGPNGSAGGNLWSDSNPYFRPVFCINKASQVPSNREPGGEACLLFQSRPDWAYGCDNARAQGLHRAGIVVGLGDGSARLVRTGIRVQVWYSACDQGSSLSPDEWW